MSASPMVKVKDPIWQVLTAYDDMKYKKVGDYEYMKMMPSGNIIFKTTGAGYGILQRQEEPLLKPIAAAIQPVQIDEFEFFKVELPVEHLDGTTTYQWTIYDHSGQILPELYDKVEVITKDHFKVTRNGISTLIDRNGNVIWNYPVTDVVFK